MSLRRELGVSFVVQGAGAASVMLATMWLGASLGPEVQGGFSRSKSEFEFIVALAMFGLPQALFFFVKSGRMSGRVALRWVACSAVAALPIGAGCALLQHPPLGVVTGLLGLAVALGVAQAALRALLLVHERTAWFNAVTALPQVLVLSGVGVVIAAAAPVAVPEPSAWFTVFAAAFGAAALLAGWRLHATLALADSAGAPNASSAAGVGWRALAHYGLAAWLTAALSTAAIVAMQRWVEAAEGRAALGRFTLALVLVQVPLTPIAYAAPLLFRRWMEQPDARASRRWSGWLFGVLLAVAALVALLAARWPDLGLGAAYAGTTQALALLLVGGAAEAASRVLTVQASAAGKPWVAVRAEVARWGVLAIGWLAVPGPWQAPDRSATNGLLALCAVWSAASIAAALVFAWRARASGLTSEAGR